MADSGPPSRDGEEISNGWEFLHFLLTDKKGIIITVCLLGILGVFATLADDNIGAFSVSITVNPEKE